MDRGLLLILTAAVLWSGGGLGIKWLKDEAGLTAPAIAGWRSLLAVPLLLAVCGGVLGRLRPGGLFLLNAGAYAVTLTTLVAATTLGTAAAAILLQYTAPVWLIVLNVLVPGGDRIGRRDLVMCGACGAGLALIVAGQEGQAGAAGSALGIFSGAAFAVLTRELRAEATHPVPTTAGGSSPLPGDPPAPVGPVPGVLAGNVLVAILCCPWMTLPDRNAAAAWAVLAGLGTLQIALPYLLFTWAVQRVPPVRATLIALLEPILSTVWVAGFHGEMPGAWAVAGGSILLATLAIDAVVPRKAAAGGSQPSKDARTEDVARNGAAGR